MKLEFKERIKNISIGIGLGLVFIAVLWLAAGLFMYYQQYRRQAAIDRWQYDFEKPYREDTYGGKTPEETWALFLAALEKRDVELASKYFEVEQQKQWKETFSINIEKNLLDETLKDFKTLHPNKGVENYENSKSRYYYFYSNVKDYGKISSTVVFRQNPLTHVWKISTL